MRIGLWLTLLVSSGVANAAPESKLWDFWTQPVPRTEFKIDHRPWQDLLQRYVKASDDGINRVAYGRFADTDRAALTGYIDMLADRDPRTLDKDAQMAYWINLYNALTIQVVLEHPNKRGILRMGGLFSIGPWNKPLLSVAGQELTLNDIEHRILRPIYQDHRIHYAVNCASFGCPNLGRDAYTADNLERLLDAGEQAYVNHPRGVSFDDRGRLVLSSIFDWYGADFADSETELLEYLAAHNATYADRLRTYDGRITYTYDWSLNSETPR